MVNQEFSLSSVLTELLYGDESSEPLERTLDRLVTPDFVQRINGQVYRRAEYADHVREMRQLVAAGGEMQVLEETGTDSAIAGRYRFRMAPAPGQSMTFESHLFARITGGRAARFVEVARQVEDGDSEDLLAGP